MENIKVPYELSMWVTESRYVVEINGQTQIVNSLKNLNNPLNPINYVLKNEYMEEVKLFDLASNKFVSPISAYKLQFTQNVNGSNDLTFNVPYKYYNEDTNTIELNPFINYLIPDRHLKLQYDYERDANGIYLKDLDGNLIPKWYDLIITSTSEAQESNVCTYKCEDMHIQELSKNGYRIELDTELENNMGTTVALASQILEDTEWNVVDTDGITLKNGQPFNSDIIKSTQNEALYECSINVAAGIQAEVVDTYTYNDVTWHKGDKVTIPYGATIYVSSSSYSEKRTPVVFLWVEGTADDMLLDSDGTILNSPNYKWVDPVHDFDFDNTLYINPKYRGEMLYQNSVTTYVPTLNAICYNYERIEYFVKSTDNYPQRGTVYYTRRTEGAVNKYTIFTGSSFDPNTDYFITKYSTTPLSSDTEKVLYYSYDKQVYPSIDSVKQLITNSTSYAIAESWDQTKVKCINEQVAVSGGYKFNSYVQVDFGNSGYCSNYGINSCKSFISPNKEPLFTVGQKYIFAIKTSDANYVNITGAVIRGINADSSSMTSYDFTTCAEYPYVVPELPSYKIYVLTVSRPLEYKVGVAYWNLRTDLLGQGNTNIKISDCLLFKEQYCDGKLVIPDLSTSIASVIETKHYMFRRDYLTFMPWIVSLEDMIFQGEYTDDQLKSNGFTLSINENYEKITSITGKESNYYNLLQDICEVFECWLKPYVERDQRGRILYEYVPTDDKEPKTGKTYYNLIGEDSTHQDNTKYASIPSAEFFKQNTSQTYYKNQQYYSQISTGGFIPVELGYQYKGHESEFYYGVFRKDDKGVSYVDYIQCSASIAYNPTFTYYTHVLGQLTLVDVYDNFSTEYATYWVIDSTKFIPSQLYERKYLKYIAFRKYVGRNNDAGFRYGINLNYITRSVDSKEICTKLYVKDLETDLLESGICSIQDAPGNFSGETSIYNFQYYINNGLLDADNFNRDLYGDETGGLAFLTTLNKWKTRQKEYTEQVIINGQALNNIASRAQSLQIYVQQSEEKLKEVVDRIADYKSITYSVALEQPYIETVDNDLIKNYKQQRDWAKKLIDEYRGMAQNVQSQYEQYQAKQNSLLQLSKNSVSKKLQLITQFYKKYSNFIKEGVWNSGTEYFSPEKYYSDAKLVSNTSAFPKISYDLKALELSTLEGYESYNFAIGDKTYIEDVEFFGYDSKGRPYKEEVIVSEVSYIIDSYGENNIKIQNYRTQFQDLFSRITAAAQTVEANKNALLVAAETISNKDAVSVMVDNILEANNAVIKNAGSQTVSLDQNGLTIIDDISPIYQLKAIGRGLFFTKDGGATWYTGVSADGLNASAINAGTINTALINICDGNHTTFTWDTNGLQAYYRSSPESPVSTSQFVRFDENGIYGCNNQSKLISHPTLEDIKQYANFSLTWDGFTFQSNKDTGWIVISDEKTDSDELDRFSYVLVPAGETLNSQGTSLFYSYNTVTGEYTVRPELKDGDVLNYPVYYRVIEKKYLTRVISVGKDSVIGQNPNFVVYSDGTMRAKNGIFEGVVRAADIVDAEGRAMFNGNTWNSRYTVAYFG